MLLALLLSMCATTFAQSFDVAISPLESGRIAVNPVTNKICAGNSTLPYVIVIDGMTNETTKIAIGGVPGPIVVNAATNKIYVGFVAGLGGKTVAVIDGATNRVNHVPVAASPYDLAVNPVTNKVYIADYYGGKLTVIDGATNKTTEVPLPIPPKMPRYAIDCTSNKF